MNLFKKFMQFAIGNGIVLILGFVSSPIITRIIGPSEMGKFSMFNTITNLLLLIVLLGTDQSYVRYYYDEEECNRKKLFIKCIKIPLIVNIFLGVLVLALYKPISLYLVDTEELFIVMLIIIHVTFSIISTFLLLQVRMKQKARFYSILNVIMKLSYLISVALLFIIYNNNYMTLVLATIASNFIMGLVAIFSERKEWFNIKKNKNIRTKSKDILNYGIPFIFSMAVTWIFQSIDRIAIKEFCGYGEVGIYSGAMSIISILNALQGAFTTFWVPVAYEKYSINPDNKEFFSKVNKIMVVLMLFIAIALISGKDIVILLLGEKYREAVFIFPYLVFMPIMYTISETTVLGINFKKKTKNHIYIAIISAAFNIVGNILLVPKYGATGSAISTGLSYIVFFIARTCISNKYYKIDYNLHKFAISIMLTYILATYSSFYRFNIYIFILTIISLITIIVLYVDIFKFGMKLLNDKIMKVRNK